MKRVLALTIQFVVLAAACKSGDSATEPTTFNGIRYSATVGEIVSGTGERQFSVIVTLKNVSSVVQTRTYTLGCPVRIRLHRLTDDRIVYDETQRTGCDLTLTGTLTIDPQDSKTLQSGVRFPLTVAGDSLPVANYRVSAVVLTESPPVDVDAGTTSLCAAQVCA